MAAATFNCPNCGAPLDNPSAVGPTVRCPFCQTEVVVPQEIRDAASAQQVAALIQSGRFPRSDPGIRLWISIALLLVLLSAGIAIYFVFQQAQVHPGTPGASLQNWLALVPPSLNRLT